MYLIRASCLTCRDALVHKIGQYDSTKDSNTTCDLRKSRIIFIKHRLYSYAAKILIKLQLYPNLSGFQNRGSAYSQRIPQVACPLAERGGRKMIYRLLPAYLLLDYAPMFVSPDTCDIYNPQFI